MTTTYSERELHDIICDYLITTEDCFTFCGICNHILCHAHYEDRTRGRICKTTENPLTQEEQERVGSIIQRMLDNGEIHKYGNDHTGFCGNTFCRTPADTGTKDNTPQSLEYPAVQAPPSQRTVAVSPCNEDIARSIDRCFIIPRCAADLHTITQNITDFFRYLEAEYYIDRTTAARNHAQAFIYTLDCTAWHYHAENYTAIATGISDAGYICRFAARGLLRILSAPDTPDDVCLYIIRESKCLLSHPSFAIHSFFDIEKFAEDVNARNIKHECCL